jgi:TonB-linked SusC/RagA family outer membrane protein
MKKTNPFRELFDRSLKKTLLTMRIAIILMILGILQARASDAYSQNTRLSLNFSETELVKVLDKIEMESEFFFMFNEKLLNTYRKVSIAANDQLIDVILDNLFAGTDVKYTIIDRKIILAPGFLTKETDATTNLQQQLVTGKVTDSKTGDAMPGVNIIIKGTTTGAITDPNGKYSIAVPDKNAILVFSFIGYGTREVLVDGKSVIDAVLESESLNLTEVVVVGYGTQRKVTLTGSVATTNAKSIAARPLTNTTQAMQGLLGVYVNQIGGQPGNDAATIRIRGIGTLNNNEPLVLVDGVASSLRDVNPNDVDNISVLKDAASASIYGNRAANGVILITTKRGNVGKLKVELNTYYGWQEATYLPDVVTNSVDWMLSLNQAYKNDGQPGPFTDAQVEEYRNGTDPDIYPNTDWYDIMFKVAPVSESNIRLSGGTEMVTFSMSLDRLKQQGVLVGTDAEKYSLNSNVVFKKSDKLEFGAIINGSFWNRNNSVVGNVPNVSRALPIHPNILADGRYGDTWLVTPGHNLFRHPLATALEGDNNYKTQRLMVNLFTQYIFPLDIKYKLTFSVNKYDAHNHRFIPEIYIYNPKQPTIPRTLRFDPINRSVQESNDNNLDYSFFQTLNWTRKIANQHDVNFLLGFSMESFHASDFNAYIEGFLGNELSEINAGTINKNVGGTSSESKLMSYFGRANYSFLDKYLFEFNFRYDGSSRFAEGNRWGFFPSISGGWRINKESFMENISSLNNLKLRASWGKLGNQQIALYSYLNNININQGTSFNNTVVGGSATTTLSDPNISWESTTMSNVGLDVGLWNNKLEIYVDVFDKSTSDILDRVNVPAQVGNLTGPITNLYSMSNKGIELSASHRNTYGKLTYSIGGSIGFVNNNVEYLNGNIQYSTNSFGNLRVIKEGSPVNSWYLYEAIGLFQNVEEINNHPFQNTKTVPGDIIYRDVNDDGTIDVKDMQVMGRSFPKYTYSFNLDFDYNGIYLNAFFQGVQDIDIYTTNNLAWGNYNGAGITKDQLANSWTADNPNAKYPRLFEPSRGTKTNSLNSTFWLHDASYLRLKNLQLGYTIPSAISNKVNISMLKVYLNAQNFLTISKYKLTDPERDVLSELINEYPTTKTFTIGCSIVF